MSEKFENNKQEAQEPEVKLSNAAADRSHTLDDEARIKVMSPGMLVIKRFLRNKLAVTGMAILLVMFLFAFLGGFLTPYGQKDVFKHDEAVLKDYATVMQNTDYRYTKSEDAEFSSTAQAQTALAISKGLGSFEADGQTYVIQKIDDESYAVSGTTVEIRINIKGDFTVLDENLVLSDDLKAAIQGAVSAGKTSLNFNGASYVITRTGKEYAVSTVRPFVLASKKVFDTYTQEQEALVNSFAFRYAYLVAEAAGETTFVCADQTYTFAEEGGRKVAVNADGQKVAQAETMMVSANANDVWLTVEMKNAARDTVVAKQDRFTHEDVEYVLNRVNQMYYVKTLTVSRLISSYEAPSSVHWLGTDGNGMDVLTRLIYGGRVSLLVGFVVVFIETFLGVVLGGISGYFGGWVDTLLMRFVDLFNCLPFYPIVMIIGAMMDKMEVRPYTRIFLLMAVLGILGWTGIARVVRGQILSLREQDFMVATEATGLRVSRRIFKHLVPNVMPLLIVQATMSLGGVIITEATLSFLGLGVKYPLASWGSMINAANDQYVLTNYWFIWIPAGILIVLTVLGFNFVGDGLRDAFDPKMKR